ncbi:MAG TPA: chloride channel protein [Bacteroidota bacterium]|nr:chloride channel protein [Bacteroidota bacterium]
MAEIVFSDLQRIFPQILFVGAAGGVIGLLYLEMLSLLGKWLSPDARLPWEQVLVMAGIGLLIAILIKVLGNPGNVELLVNNIHLLGGQSEFKNLRSLIPVSLLCIASGGAAGPEAPLVQTSGSFGTWVALKKNFSKEDIRILTITGMAAGFTVLFGAPLGSAIFALEILHRRGLEYHEALLPAILGSMCGYILCAFAAGLHLTPEWNFPVASSISRPDLAWAVAAGIVAAAVAMAFTYLNIGLRKAFHIFPTFSRPIIGGILLGLLGLWSSYALTYGEGQIGSVVVLQVSAGALAVIAAAKFLGTSMTISSGWRGGFIIPLFFVGMTLAKLWHNLLPSTNEIMLISALMAATNTGVTKTPIGSTIVVTEMAGLRILPTTLIACIITLLLTSEVGLIESQQRRDDLSH